MKRIVLLLGIFLMSAILFGCAPKVVPASPIEEKPSEVAVPVAKGGWEDEWVKTLAEAKKEGKVVVYGGSTVAGLKLHATRLLKEKFGLSLEAFSGRGADIVSKILAERRAGLFTVDLYLSGVTSIYTHFKPSGAIDPIEPALMLPEVVDPKGWLDEKIHFGDNDHMVLLWAAYPVAPIAINTNMVRPSAIKSYQDLLDPKWKGKIVVNDPTIEGLGQSTVINMLYFKAVEPDFFRHLVRHQDIILIRDQHLLNTWLVRGKYPIALGLSWGRMSEYLEAGAPIASVRPIEGVSLRAAGAAMSLMNKAPHPNAAKVFINWFLSREGQALVQKAVQKQSRRIDIPAEGLIAAEVRQPGVKYPSSPYDEEKFSLQEFPKYEQLVKEIFGPLVGR